MPSATYSFLRQHLSELSPQSFQYSYSLLYTAYSTPNIIMPIALGYWVDKMALKEVGLNRRFQITEKMLVFLTILMTFGHAIFSVGVWYGSVHVMVLGRLLFGVGGESISVMQARLASATVSCVEEAEQELAATFGVLSAVAQLGSIINNIVSPKIALTNGLMGSTLVGLLVCCGAIVMAGLLVLLRPRGDQGKNAELTTPPLHPPSSSMASFTANSPMMRTIVLFLLAAIHFTYNGAMYPYNNISSAYLRHRFYPNQTEQDNQISISIAMSIPDAVAIVLALCQLLLPRFTRRIAKPIIVTLSGGFLFAIAHFALLMTKTTSTPLPALFLLGLANTTVMWGWSVVPSLLPPSHHTLAYALMTSTTNLAISVVPLIVAALITRDDTFTSTGIFFGVLGLCGIVLATILYWLYKRACVSKKVQRWFVR